jgi:hypothetical protein
MYRIAIPGSSVFEVMNRLRTGRTAASVFPEAVGEIRRTFSPSTIFGMACA